MKLSRLWLLFDDKGGRTMNVKEVTEVFNNTVSDLQTINWSETDDSDVRKILKEAFTRYLNHKPEIIKMFEETSSLNKFQKLLIIEILKKM